MRKEQNAVSTFQDKKKGAKEKHLKKTHTRLEHHKRIRHKKHQKKKRTQNGNIYKREQNKTRDKAKPGLGN